MKAITLISASSIFFTGCMNTHDLTQAVPELRRDEVNARLLGKTWTIEKLDGLSMKGRVTAASLDSITFADEFTGQISTVPTRELATVSSSSSAVGPVLGFLGGGALGVFIGFLIGESSSNPNTVEGVAMAVVVNGPSDALIGGAIGAPVGLAVGGVLSAGSAYVFNPRDGGNAGPDTTIIIDRQDIISQTDIAVTFRWGGKERIVSKRIAMISPIGEKVRIVLPRAYIHR
jgi:hypothetical protein